MYQTPPTPGSNPDNLSEDSISDQLSAAAETISSKLSFSFLDEMSGAALLACIFLVAASIFLVMWYYEYFISWVKGNWQNNALRWRRWRHRKNHLPVLEVRGTSFVTAEEDELREQDELPTRDELPEQDTHPSRIKGWFLSHRQEAHQLQTTGWFLDHQGAQRQRPSDWFLNQPQPTPANETQTNVDLGTEVESEELNARLTLYRDQAAKLEEKLAFAEERLAETENQNQLLCEQQTSTSTHAGELAAELAEAKQKLEAKISLAEESELALIEAREELGRLTGVEKELTVENEELRLKWETVTADSSAAVEKAELSNQDLIETLETESAAHERVKMDLVMARQSMEVLRARIDCQRDSLDVAHQENTQSMSEHATALEDLKAAQSAVLATKKSEFDAMSNALTSQVTELQGALDSAHVETKQLRAESAELQEIIDSLKANEGSSASLLEESRLELAGSVAELKREGAQRAEFEEMVERLKQELQSQSEVAAAFEAELLESKESLNSRIEMEQQQQMELQGKVEDFKKELESRAVAFSALESDLSRSQEALVAAQAEKGQREAELQADVERLEKDLSSRTAAFTNLETDLSTTEEALVAARAEKGEREAELLADVERLEQDLSTRAAALTNLEADLSKTEEALVAARAEKGEREAELQADVERLEQDLSTRTAAFTNLETDLSTTEEALVAARAEKGERELELQADVERLEQDLSTRTAAFTALESDLLKSEAAIVAARSEEGERALELQADVKRLENELSMSAAELTALEANLLKSEEALVAAQSETGKRESELQADVQRLEQELSTQGRTTAQLRADLSKAEKLIGSNAATEQQRQEELLAKVEGLEQDLVSRAAAFSKLESELSDAQQALADTEADKAQGAMKLRTDVQRAEEEINQLRLALSAEKTSAAESVEKLAANEALVLSLKDELSVASVNRANYMKIANKLVRYKALSRQKEAKLEDLLDQNMRMSDLATEYFENVKEARNELNSQAKLVEELKQQLQEAEQKHAEAAKADLSRLAKGPSEEELDRLVQQRARKYLLKMKSECELLIKRKNSTIRRLRKEQAIKSKHDGNGLVTSDGQPNNSEPDSPKVNLPR